MVNMTNRPYVAVRLCPFKFFFRHFSFLCSASVPPVTTSNQYGIVFFAAKLFVVRTQELLFLNQSIGKNPTSEALVLRPKPRAKILKTSIARTRNLLPGTAAIPEIRTRPRSKGSRRPGITASPKSQSYRKPFQNLPACRSPPETFDR
jgi:hypothetical protein